MKAALENGDRLLLALPRHLVDQPVLSGEPARPAFGEIALQLLWLANPRERRSAHIFDQLIQSQQQIDVVNRPPAVVIPGIVRE